MFYYSYSPLKMVTGEKSLKEVINVPASKQYNDNDTKGARFSPSIKSCNFNITFVITF